MQFLSDLFNSIMATTWQDLANGLFEFFAGFALLNHCRVAYKDKMIRGASAVSVLFFTLWGIWNLYYYPHLGQWASFLGGLFIMTGNAIWVGLMLYYRHTPVEKVVANNIRGKSPEEAEGFLETTAIRDYSLVTLSNEMHLIDDSNQRLVRTFPIIDNKVVS